MRALLVVFCLLFSVNMAMAEIVIATVGPMKGPNGVFGEQMKRGAEAAVAAVNAAGGINGEMLRLEIADDACDGKQAIARAQELLAKDVRFIAGHFCSGASIAAAKTYEQAGVLMISPSASNPKFTDGGGWNVHRLASRDDGQADVAVSRIRQSFGAAKVAVLDDGQPASAALAARFKTVFGADVVAMSFKGGEASYAGLVNDLQEAGVSLIYMASAAGDAGKIARQLQEAGVTAQLMGSDTLLADDFGTAASEASEGTLATFTSDPMTAEAAKDVIAAFRAASFEPEGATLATYASVQAFVAAAKATTVNDGQAMAKWLRAGNRIETVIGTVALDARGDLNPPTFVWYKWSAGRYAVEVPVN